MPWEGQGLGDVNESVHDEATLSVHRADAQRRRRQPVHKCFENCQSPWLAHLSTPGMRKEAGPAGSEDARGRRGPGWRLFLLQRTFQKASHCRDPRHWRTVDPFPFIWAALPAPRPGLWSVHSESQMHAWAPATDRVRRVCWPGRALSSPDAEPGQLGWYAAALASCTLLCSSVVKAEALRAGGC